MPAKHIIKPYVKNSYYHIYNRGVNKELIFFDKQDYGVFLSYLKTYLLPKDTKALQNILQNPQGSYKERNEASKLLRLKNFTDRIDLISYCLMPNHFHLLIKQKKARDIEEMMKSLLTRYTMYVNNHHKRIGPLFQSNYKAVLVETQEQLLHLTRYIHRNPLARKISHERLDLLRQKPSSYANFLGELRQSWVKPESILKNFFRSNPNLYKEFVEQNDGRGEEESLNVLSEVMIDSNQP